MAIGINLSDIQPGTIKVDEALSSIELQLRYYQVKIVADDQVNLKALIAGLQSLIEVEKPKEKESGELPDFYKG